MTGVKQENSKEEMNIDFLKHLEYTVKSCDPAENEIPQQLFI